jgi:tetratricopeptide (TPR) repeat protein
MGSHPVSRIAASATLAFACLVAMPNLSWAGDESAAETLFQEGLAAMKRNDYPVACEAFSQSNKADPSPGTQINLAVCYEKQKKWASAWTWYRSAVGLAQQRGQAEREKLAEESASRLKPQLHYVVVSVKEPLTDLVVKRDGAEVTIALAGKEVPLPVDPGEHTIDVSARGKKPWTKTIQIADNTATDRIDVPKLENMPEEKSAGTPAGPGTDYRPPVVVANDGSSQRTVGVVVAGAGVLSAVAAGVVFALAKSEESKSDDRYAEAGRATEPNQKKNLETAAASNHDAAERNQLIAIALGGGAVVLLGVGAVLYFTAPKGSSTTTGSTRLLPLVGPSFAGVGLGGSF